MADWQDDDFSDVFEVILKDVHRFGSVALTPTFIDEVWGGFRKALVSLLRERFCVTHANIKREGEWVEVLVVTERLEGEREAFTYYDTTALE